MEAAGIEPASAGRTALSVYKLRLPFAFRPTAG